MSIPSFSEFPPIPQRSTPEADFDAKMYALFQHFAVTHRAEMLAFIDFLETNSTVIGAALNGTTIGLTTPAAGKFTALEADSLGGAAVQSDIKDGTAGRLLKVGAFGLGSDAANVATTAELDALTDSGIYKIAEAISGVLDSGSLVLHLNNSSSNATQIGFRAGSGIAKWRRKTGGVWQGWVTLFTHETVVGTVSQSAGVPSGAVIERGSNANGEYVRFADGTQICQSFQLLPYAGSAATLQLTWNYPAGFTTRPNIMMTPLDYRDGGAPAGGNWSGGERIDVYTRVTGSTSATLYAAKDASWVSGDAVPVHVVAIGRWY